MAAGAMVKTNRAELPGAWRLPAFAIPSPEGALHSPRMAGSLASHRPIKGILKNKVLTASSAEATAQQSGGAIQVKKKKSQRWDELNILATCHPLYRDYGLMKINEPSTTHFSMQDGGEDIVCDLETKDPIGDMTIDLLAKKLSTIDTSESNCPTGEPESSVSHPSQFFLDKQEKQRRFELKRKLHYSDGLNIKLARQLIARDFEHDEEMEDENEQCSYVTNEKKIPAEESKEDPASDELQIQPHYV